MNLPLLDPESRHVGASQFAFTSESGGATWRNNRALLVAAAGAVIILISLLAALLPLVEVARGAIIIGSMMVLAGLVETIAGTLRPRRRGWSMLPGTITILAGGMFAVDPFDAFVPMVRLVIAWLAARGVILLIASAGARGSVRFWTLLAAGADLALGGILLAGLSASAFAIALFGPTPDVVSSFAFVLAISFVATGLMLLEVAAFEFTSNGG